MIYLSVLLLLAFLSFHYDINGRRAYISIRVRNTNRDTWYRFMLVVFILIAGLRWRVGIDTPPYLSSFYHEISTLDNLSNYSYTIGEDPFWYLLNSLVKTLGGRFYMVQLIHASIINILIFKFIKKYSNYWFTCLFFYAITCYTTYNMEILRGSISIVICLYANDYILEKKWLKGYMLYLLALMFHAQTLMMFVLPIFFFLRFNKLGVLTCIGAFLLGNVIMSMFSDYLFLFEDNETMARKLNRYAASDYAVQIKNINFFITQIFPMLFYSIFSFLYLKHKSHDNKLLKFEPLIVLGVVFILIRMNLEIAYRYVDYFKIYFVLVFSECFIRMIRYQNKVSPIIASLKSFIIFLPLFLVLLVYNYIISETYSLRYTPYSSIFEKGVSRERESMYMELNATKAFYPPANKNEY